MPRGPSNYVPRPDGAFDGWVQHFRTQLHAWWEAQGLDTNSLKPLDDAVNAWSVAYPANTAAQAAAMAAKQGKDAARARLEDALRPLARFVQSFPSTTDADRATLGLTVPKDTRTPTATPTSRPRASVVGGTRLTHELLVVDESSPTSRGRPPGTTGAELWFTLVSAGEPAPTDPAVLRYHSTTTRPTVRTTFEPRDGGKTAVYMLRWVSTRGDKGPWSEPVTGTVAA